MAEALSDEEWRDICAIGASHKPPLTPDAEARAVLSAILFDECPAFAYDPAREAARLKRSERMLKQLDGFAELYRQRWLPELPRDQFQAVLGGHAVPLTDDEKTKAHFVWLAMLRRSAEADWLGARAIRRANKGPKSLLREWLYHRLASVWLDHFGGELAYSRPSRGGPPSGPLVKFILAAFQVVAADALPKYRARRLPKTEAVAKAIVRERKGASAAGS